MLPILVRLLIPLLLNRLLAILVLVKLVHWQIQQQPGLHKLRQGPVDGVGDGDDAGGRSKVLLVVAPDRAAIGRVRGRRVGHEVVFLGRWLFRSRNTRGEEEAEGAQRSVR